MVTYCGRLVQPVLPEFVMEDSSVLSQYRPYLHTHNKVEVDPKDYQLTLAMSVGSQSH